MHRKRSLPQRIRFHFLQVSLRESLAGCCSDKPLTVSPAQAEDDFKALPALRKDGGIRNSTLLPFLRSDFEAPGRCVPAATASLPLHVLSGSGSTEACPLHDKRMGGCGALFGRPCSLCLPACLQALSGATWALRGSFSDTRIAEGRTPACEGSPGDLGQPRPRPAVS